MTRERLLFVCAFLTGFSALLYETVWQRVLGLFSGSDVVSAALVVSAYLAGLAVGSLLSSFVVDRLPGNRLLWTYAGLTVAVGLFGALSTPLFYQFVYLRLGVMSLSIGSTYGVLFASLMIPTALMGASFPVLGKILCRRHPLRAGERLSILNGVNILGAVLGSLVSGWYLIGTLGYESSTYVGAAVDVAAAVLALVAGIGLSDPVDAAVPVTSGAGANAFVTRAVVNWAALTLLSGFLAVSLEIVWLRLLSIYIKSNPYLFAHLIAWVLFGFGAGSLVGARMLRTTKGVTHLFLLAQVGIVLYALASNLLVVSFYPAISQWLGTGLTTLDPGHGWALVASDLGRYVGIPLVILFPAAALIGLTFPCAQQAVQDDPALVGARIGLIQTANLIGNILGGLLTGLYLLNHLSSFATLRLLGGIGLVFAAILLSRRSRTATAVLLTLCLAGLVAAYPSTTSMMRSIHNIDVAQPFVYSEDASGIATLIGIEPPGWDAYMLYVDGILESQIPFDSGHPFLGIVGAFAHPRPESIFVVGIGAGGTPFSSGVSNVTRRIKAVEIISSELKALDQIRRSPKAQGFDEFMRDPRVEVVIGDARKLLMASPETFDIIEADAIKPRRPHSGLIYSAEFFQLARARLKPGGLFVSWTATPRVVATMLSVFPYVMAVDWVLIGSDSPITVDTDTLTAKMSDPRAQRYLTAAGISAEGMARLLAHARLKYWTPSDVRATADVNTDLKPKDEFYMNNPDGTAQKDPSVAISSSRLP